MSKMGRPRVQTPSVTVSIRGDQTTKEALRRIAVRKQLYVADLVRIALDVHLDGALEAETAKIRAENGKNSHH